LCLLTPGLAAAGSALVEMTLEDGRTAEAEYWPGETQLPAVLILHGFLATRDFPTVRRLAESLAEEGHSVLLPTLTLGLDRRRQSVACEAIHTQSMEQDIDELRRWVGWMREHHGGSPAIVGHSAGGVQITAMLDRYRALDVSRSVLISLSYFGEEQGPELLAELRARAEHDLGAAPDGMQQYALSYCRDYVTTPQRLLSYLAWDKPSMTYALNRSPVPVSVIYGGGDKRIDADWLRSLDGGAISVHMVPGANHFFDLAHEFDLLDEVLQLINRGAHG
jgi:pimeloyl-ACP methyl ester carboxylesterase